MDLPTGAGGGQLVCEWSRLQDFLGNDKRIFWRQANDSLGTELHTINMNSADPAATLTVVDVFPGVGQGANFGDAVFANGRIYWQASADSTADTMRLWTTTDGTGTWAVLPQAAQRTRGTLARMYAWYWKKFRCRHSRSWVSCTGWCSAPQCGQTTTHRNGPTSRTVRPSAAAAAVWEALSVWAIAAPSCG